VLDMALCLEIPGMTVFAPSSAQDLVAMLRHALTLDGPAVVRYPKGSARQVSDEEVGSALEARRLRAGEGDVCILAVGKMVEAAEKAAVELAQQDVSATVWDVRVVKPLDADMLADAARHRLVVTVEDGIRFGGAGSFMADAIAQIEGVRSVPPVLVLGTPVAYIAQGKPDRIHADLGLDGAGIAASVSKAWQSLGVEPA